MFDAAFDLFFSRPGGEGRAGSIPGTQPAAGARSQTGAGVDERARTVVARRCPRGRGTAGLEHRVQRRGAAPPARLSRDELGRAGVGPPAAPPVAVAGRRAQDPAPARRPSRHGGAAPHHASRRAPGRRRAPPRPRERAHQASPDRDPLRRQRLDGSVLASPARLRACDRPARARRDLRVFDTSDQNHAPPPSRRHRFGARPRRQPRCTTSAAGRASPTRCTPSSATTRAGCSVMAPWS